VRRLYVDPSDGDVFVVATTHAGAGIGVGKPPIDMHPGVFRHESGGWHATLLGDATALVVAPDFARQYAAIGRPFGSSAAAGVEANGLYRSIDGGMSWNPIPGPWDDAPAGVGRIELAMAPSDPNVVYAGVTDAFGDPANPTDGHLLGLWRTTTAWAANPAAQAADPAPVSWEAIVVPPLMVGSEMRESYCEDECWYTHVLTVDPMDANVLYAGGIRLWRRNGSAWEVVGSDAIHVDQHAFAWIGERLVVGNDGGVSSSNDDGLTWQSHSDGLAITQFYDGAIDALDPAVAIGGTQDNGTILWQPGLAWSRILGSDGLGNAISHRGIANGGALITTQGGGIFRRQGDGTVQVLVAPVKDQVPFATRAELCAHADVALATSDRLIVSRNAFGSTVEDGFKEPAANLGTCPGAGCVTALAFAPSDIACATYAVATMNSEETDGVHVQASIHVTTDSGTSWVTHSTSDAFGDLPRRYVSDLAFAPSDPEVLVAAFSGFANPANPGASGHVFRTTASTDVSRPWLDVSPPTMEPATAVAFDPVRTETLYVGTNFGLWSSSDGGVSWTHAEPADGMPNVAVYDLAVHPCTFTVFAFTHGRGAFTLGCTATDECDDSQLCTADVCAEAKGCEHPRLSQPGVADRIPSPAIPACAGNAQVAAMDRQVRKVRKLLYKAAALDREIFQQRAQRMVKRLRDRRIGKICRQRRIDRGKVAQACCDDLRAWSTASGEIMSCLVGLTPDPQCRPPGGAG